MRWLSLGAVVVIVGAHASAGCGSDDGGGVAGGGGAGAGAGGSAGTPSGGSPSGGSPSGGAPSGGAPTGGTSAGGTGGDDGGATGGMAGSSFGGSAGSPSDAGGPLICASGTETFKLTVSQAEQFKRIPLPLKPGVEYRRVTLQFDYVPTAWSGTCYNPATTKKLGFPIFESLIALKRGNHWCKGGDLFEVTLQGPASGHGASNKADAQTYYKAKQFTGSGCGGSDVEAKIFNGAHGISAGTVQSATITYDQAKGTLVADVGPSTHTGLISPLAKLIANGSEQWNVVFSSDGGFLECYNAQGQADPTAPCCWGPSIGWVFQNLTWEICY